MAEKILSSGSSLFQGGKEEKQFSESWESFKNGLMLVISGTLHEIDDMNNIFLPSPYWDPLSPLYYTVQDFLSQQQQPQNENYKLEELFKLNLVETSANRFFSHCQRELKFLNNTNDEEEVGENGWRELYLEKLCLCILLEGDIHSLRVPDTMTTATTASSSPHVPLKRRVYESLSEALVVYPPAYHTLHTTRKANSKGYDDSADQQQKQDFLSLKHCLILRLVSSCARLSLRLLWLLMNSTGGGGGCVAAVPTILKTDEMCRCLSAVLPLTADFTVGDTSDTVWTRAESLLLLHYHSQQRYSTTTLSTLPLPCHGLNALIDRLPWNKMKDMSKNVVWPSQHEVVLTCSLMLLREARDVVKCICNGYGDCLSAIANAHATTLAREFRRNMHICKAMYPCDDDNPRNMEQSLVLTGSQVPLEISAFTQHSAPETAIIIGISIVTEEACKCGSYHNNTGRRDDEDDRAGFSHVDALGELLPVILPFADYWEVNIASLGLTSLLRVVFLATSTQVGWHRPLLLESFGRALRVLRDETALSLAIAGIATVLAAVPISEASSIRKEAGSLLKEVCRQAVLSTSESHRLVTCRGLCIILESPVFQCDFGLIPHITIVLGLLLPLLQSKVIPNSPSGHLTRLAAIRCVHSLCIACWPRMPAHEMSIMSVLIGFCFELKNKSSNNISSQCGGDSCVNNVNDDAMYDYGTRVCSLVHLLCSIKRKNKDDAIATEERALSIISRKISCLQPVCQDIANVIRVLNK